MAREIVTREHVSGLADQLAKAAGITAAQAGKVLEVLHIGKLNENMVAMHDLLQNQHAVNALGLSHDDAQKRLAGLSSANVTLANLRIGVKGPGAAGILV